MSIQVIGAGLGRTGTLSLKFALEKIGFGPCYHMMELADNPDRLRYWKELHRHGETDFEALFDGYRSAVDNPACMYYKELFRHYPEAKVILTVRDPEKWYDSTLNTIYGTSAASKSFVQNLGMIFRVLTNSNMRKMAPVFQYADQAIWKDFFKGHFENKAKAIKRYHEHTEEVKSTIPSDQLLIFEVKDGWKPLCEFLNVQIPSEPFPRTNPGTDFKQNIDEAMRTGRVKATFIANLKS